MPARAAVFFSLIFFSITLQAREVEFILSTIPKTGTHFMRPYLEYISDKTSVSYWSPEVACPKAYLYDKTISKLLSGLPDAVQLYWLHQPILKNNVKEILSELSVNEGFLTTHAPYSLGLEKALQKRQGVIFFLIRDPRDWIISVINHPPMPGIDIYGQPFGDLSFLSLNHEEKIERVLKGTPDYYSTLEIYSMFLPWIDSPSACTLRFEALLGPQGGYSTQNQLAEFRKIAAALQMQIPDEILMDAFYESFGKGALFIKAKAGIWKEHFSDKNKVLAKKLLNGLLIKLGYEKDDQW